jgi:hypothetical protein
MQPPEVNTVINVKVCVSLDQRGDMDVMLNLGATI